MEYHKMIPAVLVSMMVLMLGFSGCTSRLHSAVIGENEGLNRSHQKATASVVEDTLPPTGVRENSKEPEIEPVQSFLGEPPPYPKAILGEETGEGSGLNQSSSPQSIFAQSPNDHFSNSQNPMSGMGSLHQEEQAGDEPFTGSQELFSRNADSLSQGNSDSTFYGEEEFGGHEGLLNSSGGREGQENPLAGRDIVTGLVGEEFMDHQSGSQVGLDQKEIADIFFDFDQALIREDARSVLETNADLLTSRYEGAGLLIEGHCDEWGTAEYNLVLGQRRAEVAKRYLVDLGVPASKMETVSYGKERPFCARSNQRCWERNRRSHFVVKQQLTPNDFK